MKGFYETGLSGCAFLRGSYLLPMTAITEEQPHQGDVQSAPDATRSVALAPIVVAVDGGPESRSALRWASKRARQLGCDLRVVTAFTGPTIASESGMAFARAYGIAEATARRRSSALIASVVPDRTVEHVVRLGDPVSILEASSHDAQMIVVGTRRRERIWHRWRSSLTNRLTGLITCPVVSISSGEGYR